MNPHVKEGTSPHTMHQLAEELMKGVFISGLMSNSPKAAMWDAITMGLAIGEYVGAEKFLEVVSKVKDQAGEHHNPLVNEMFALQQECLEHLVKTAELSNRWCIFASSLKERMDEYSNSNNGNTAGNEA